VNAVTVFIPTQLRSYTGGATQVEASGATVDEALKALDARYPGIRFRVIDEQGRIRQHMRVFVDGERVREVGGKIGACAEVHIFGALSGG
jgi:molybdopterin converting factor small subunit